MLETLKNAFRIKDIRKKLFYTFCMMVVIRMGSQLPIPGVNRNYFSQWFAQQSNDAFNFFSAFTGGSFEKMSIFALSITPYITSSIIIQLLTIAIPALEEIQGWRRSQKENCLDYAVCHSCTCPDREYCNDRRLRKIWSDSGSELPEGLYGSDSSDGWIYFADVDW